MKLIKSEIIVKYIKDNNLSKSEFAKRCKISIGVLNKILSNNPNFRANALFKVARYMGVHIKELVTNERLN